MKAKEKLSYVSQMYDEVVTRFPGINKKLIKPVLNNSFHSYIGLSYSYGRSLKAKLIITDSFFELPVNQQKAAIAHELGHYEDRIRKKTRRKLNCCKRWALEYTLYNERACIFKNLNQEELHKLKRFQRRQTLREIYADNKAAKAGYGPDLLKFLNGNSQNNQRFISQEMIERYKARIVNLEKRVGM